MRFVADLIATALLLALFAYCLTRALGAPAPTPRPPVPLGKAIQGHWSMEWGSAKGQALVGPRGFWGCYCLGTHYRGSWELEGGVLTIREYRLEDPSRQESTYRIALVEPVRGRVGVSGVIEGQGTAFSLTP